MVKMLAELPNAKTLVTTLGSRGAVMVARVDDVLDETTTTTTTLRELVGSLEAEAKAKETKENGDAKSAVPLPAVPATSATVYLEDAGADAATKLGPVRVTFAPAAAMRAEQIADTTGAGRFLHRIVLLRRRHRDGAARSDAAGRVRRRQEVHGAGREAGTPQARHRAGRALPGSRVMR
jgi:sugar/nucleoside kinase (ribokinase family)